MSHSANDSRSDFSGWGSRASGGGGGWTGGDWTTCSRGGNDSLGEPDNIFSLGDNSMGRKKKKKSSSSKRRICPSGKILRLSCKGRKSKRSKKKKSKSRK